MADDKTPASGSIEAAQAALEGPVKAIRAVHDALTAEGDKAGNFRNRLANALHQLDCAIRGA